MDNQTIKLCWLWWSGCSPDCIQALFSLLKILEVKNIQNLGKKYWPTVPAKCVRRANLQAECFSPLILHVLSSFHYSEGKVVAVLQFILLLMLFFLVNPKHHPRCWPMLCRQRSFMTIDPTAECSFQHISAILGCIKFDQSSWIIWLSRCGSL